MIEKSLVAIFILSTVIILGAFVILIFVSLAVPGYLALTGNTTLMEKIFGVAISASTISGFIIFGLYLD